MDTRLITSAIKQEVLPEELPDKCKMSDAEELDQPQLRKQPARNSNTRTTDDKLADLKWIEIVVDVEQVESVDEGELESSGEEKYEREQEGKIEAKKVILEEGCQGTKLSNISKHLQNPFGLYQLSSVTTWFGEEKEKNIKSQKEKLNSLQHSQKCHI